MRFERSLAIAFGLMACLGGSTAMADPPGDGGVAHGELVVRAEGTSAEVSIDGRPRGPAPVTVTLSPGLHRVAVTVGGETIHHREVEVFANQRAEETFAREPECEATAPPPPAVPAALMETNLSNTEWSDTDYLHGGLALGVGLGFTVVGAIAIGIGINASLQLDRTDGCLYNARGFVTGGPSACGELDDLLRASVSGGVMALLLGMPFVIWGAVRISDVADRRHERTRSTQARWQLGAGPGTFGLGVTHAF